MNEDQISLWIERLRDGDQRAPEEIWRQYFEKLVRLARRRLGEMPKRAVDEEDVALSALNSLTNLIVVDQNEFRSRWMHQVTFTDHSNQSISVYDRKYHLWGSIDLLPCSRDRSSGGKLHELWVDH